MELFLTLFVVAMLVVGVIQKGIRIDREKKEAQKLKERVRKALETRARALVVDALPLPGGQSDSFEIVNDDGIPEFKHRFSSDFNFFTPSSALLKHGVEEFIPRPGGDKSPISEIGGYWLVVSSWGSAEIRRDIEEEPFKYIGGLEVYHSLLLAVRRVYEDSGASPREKREIIKVICEENKNAYMAKRVQVPPWESLLVPVFSLAEGLGPHRVSLLRVGNIRTIADACKRTDAEILAIKGIGRSALSAVRNLSSLWPYDKNTEIIEKDPEYRRVLGSDCNIH